MKDTVNSADHPRVMDDIPFQVLVEQSLVGVYLIQDGILKYCNEAFAAITGHEPYQLINHPIRNVVAPDSIDTVEAMIAERLSRGLGASTRYFNQAVHVDGYIVDLETHGRAIEYEGRPAVAGVAVNMTRQLSYERDLRQKNLQLKKMSRHINQVREDERQELSRNLHDVLGGLLTSIKMSATRIMKRASDKETLDIADDILALSQECIDFARHKSEQLYPVSLSYLGLEPALTTLLKQFEKRSDVVCQLQIKAPLTDLPNETALIIYRALQESLTNIARHSQAHKVVVTLLSQQQKLIIQIDDDGVGFDTTQARTGASGLLHMRERAAEVDGEVIITKSPLGGTRVSLVIPESTRATDSSCSVSSSDITD